MLAVIAGFAATVLLAAVIDGLVHVAVPGAFGPDGKSPGAAIVVGSIAYTMACAATGGYLAAFLARRHEVLHALALGTLGALATLLVIAVVPVGQRAPAQFVSAMLVIPATMLGGWLRSRTPRRTR